MMREIGWPKHPAILRLGLLKQRYSNDLRQVQWCGFCTHRVPLNSIDETRESIEKKLPARLFSQLVDAGVLRA